MTGSGRSPKNTLHPSSTDLSESAGTADQWPSRQVAARIAAALMASCGLLSLGGLIPPNPVGADTRGVLLVGSSAALTALIAWFLPWRRWPCSASLSLAAAGLVFVALLNVYLRDYPQLYAVFFLVIFLWIGIAHPRRTAFWMLPLFSVAYLAPMIHASGDLGLAAKSAVYVGVLCLLVAEVMSWLVDRWRHSQRALREAHVAFDDICSQFGGGAQDSAELWQASAARLCALLDVSCCDVYRVAGDEALICLGSMCDGGPYPEYIGRRGELSLWGTQREAMQSRSLVLIATPHDPRLNAAERAEMIAWHQQALLFVPLVVGDEVLGLVELGEQRADRTITAEQAATATSICRLIALSVRDAEIKESLSERTRSLAALLEATQAVSSSVVLQEVLDQVARSAADMLGSPEWVIWEYEPATESLIERAIISEDPAFEAGTVAPLSESPTEAQVLFGGESLVEQISDPHLDPASRASMEKYGEKTCLTVALRFGEEPVGLLVAVETAAERHFSPMEVEALESLGRQAAVAIHNARLYRRQHKHARRLASLLESSRAIASAGSMEEALAIVIRSAVELFELTSGIAYEHDQERDVLIARAVWETRPSEWNALGKPFALADRPVERKLLASGGALLECLSDPDLDSASRATMEYWDEKSCLTVTMQSVDGPMGLLTLCDAARERRYSADELALASSLAELAGEAVRTAKLVKRLQRLSETDSLTGLANHRRIHDLLALEQARAERYGTHFSLAMIDIDGFKLLNDTHGHPAGDTVLRQIAGMLAESTRASDIVGRYGGDEFLLILPETAPTEAAALADKLRAALAQTPYVTPTGERIPLCASFGIAAYPNDGRDGNELVAVADANLYASKRRGGDAVTGGEEAEALQSDDPGTYGLFESLVIAVDNKDCYTRCHSEEVTEHALAIAEALGLSEKSRGVLRIAGLLHDVGKIGIPDRILRKPGRLSEAEYEVVKGHSALGGTIIAAIPDVEEIRAAIVSHHERYDGAGYPDGRASSEIPLLGRILAVADTYSAMTTDRPYRKALTHQEALAELRACSGTQFDPAIVEVFVGIVGDGAQVPAELLVARP